MIMLKSKGLTQQPTMSLTLRKQYQVISKTRNKKAIEYIGNQGELLKKFKDTENVFDNAGQSRSRIYLKISPNNI